MTDFWWTNLQRLLTLYRIRVVRNWRKGLPLKGSMTSYIKLRFLVETLPRKGGKLIKYCLIGSVLYLGYTSWLKQVNLFCKERSKTEHSVYKFTTRTDAMLLLINILLIEQSAYLKVKIHRKYCKFLTDFLILFYVYAAHVYKIRDFRSIFHYQMV